MVLCHGCAGPLPRFTDPRFSSPSVLASLHTQEVSVGFPHFSFRTNVPLKATLQSLGMTDAFAGGVADLSGMDGSRGLYLQDVLHQGFIGVDEAGTEAAAATAVVVGRLSAGGSIRMDRPFLFLIRDVPTGAVLFLGRVLDPSAR